jgi:hypothetical protein
MPIQRSISPDFQKPAICTYLNSARPTYDDEEAEAKKQWTTAGYQFVAGGNGKRKLANATINLRTFVARECKVFTPANRLLQSPTIIDAIDHNLDCTIFALLFVRPALAKPLIDQITQAFQTTDPSGPDLGAAETAIIKAGAQMDDYQVTLIFELTRLRPPEDKRTNLTAFEDQIKNYKDRNGRPVYELEVTEKIELLCDAPSNAFDDRNIITGDVDHPEKAITDYENGQGHPCEGLEITDHRIGTAFQYYEWKTEWKVRPIRIGPCEIMRTKIPVIYSRIRKQALWGYAMTEAELKRNIEKAIIDCLERAAIETGALIIVTGGWALDPP